MCTVLYAYTDGYRHRESRQKNMGCSGSRPSLEVITPEAAAATLPPPVMASGSADGQAKPRSLAAPPDQILEWLFLGDHGASVSYKTLVDLGITHVLNVKGGFKIPPAPYDKQLTIKSVPLDDYGSSDIAAALQECAAFINSARDTGGCCLVHCSQGMNRSPSIVLAYLVSDSRTSWTLREAWLHLRTRRPMVSPLRVYFEQIQKLEVSLRKLKVSTLSAEESGIHV